MANQALQLTDHACKRAAVQWEEAKASCEAPASAPAVKRNVRGKRLELTKFERRVLRPNYLRICRWSLLIPGLIFLAVGLTIAVWGSIQARRVELKWGESLKSLSAINTTTEREKIIMDTAIFHADSAAKGWSAVIHEKTKSAAEFFLLIGGFIVSIYIRERRYRGLIDKLAPNQAL